MRIRLVLAAVLLCALPVLGQEPHVTFMTQFEEAVKADNYAAMKDLVIKNKPNYQAGFAMFEGEYCSAVSNKSDEDQKHRMNILEKLSTLVSQEFKDKALNERLAWLKTLTPEQCVKRIEFGEVEYEGEQLFRKAEKSGDKAEWKASAAKFEKAYAIAVALADAYWQVNLNNWLAGAYLGAGELFETAFHYKRTIELARDLKQGQQLAGFDAAGRLKKIAAQANLRDDLIDITLTVEEAKKKYNAAIEKAGADAGNPGGAGTDSKPGAGAGAASGPKGAMPSTLPPLANKHTARIEWVDAEKPKYKEVVGRTVPTPNIRANGPWLNWYDTAIAPGAPSKSNAVPGENAIKNDKGKILFDADGAGKASEERLKVQEGKADVVVFKARPYQDTSLAKADVHHRLMVSPINFNVNGVSLKLERGSPADTPVQLRWQGATAVTAKFDGYDVTISDDSANGEFNNWGEDSIVISKGPWSRVVPLSQKVYLGDLLYELKLDANGQNMRFKPYDGPLALLEFKYVATTMPTFMILEGMNENAQTYVNLMDCKDKPMWVPPGEYKFKDGYFMVGEGDKRETIAVKNTNCTQFKVAEGQLTKCEMGGAKAPGFTFAWKAELEKEKGKTMVKMRGKHIQVFGGAGEEYHFFLCGVVRPQVKMRNGKDGPVFFDKQMKAPATEDLDEKKAWPDVVFFPKDIEAEKTISGDVWIQLEGEYPKFGKITSTPKQVQ